MSSLIIIYDGQRKTVKIPSPNTLMQSILAEASLHFKLDPSLCQLKHKRSIVDNSQPFRFANLSNNSLVDLVVVESSGSAKRAGATCKIALSIEGTTGTLTNTYDATISLLDMLNTLVTDDKLAVNFLDLGCEVIYLRSNFSSEEILRSTSFASIGLSGQSARLQIRFLNKSSVSAVFNNTSTVTSNPAEQCTAVAPVAIENSSNDSEVLVSCAMDVVENAATSDSAKEVLSAEDIVNSMVVDEFIAPLSQHSGNNGNSGNSSSNDSGSYGGVVSEVASKFISSMNQSNNSIRDSKSDSNSGSSSKSDAKADYNSEEHKQKVAKQSTAPATPVVVDLAQSTELIGLMLTRNFDSVTIPAVTTIAKYIGNILNNYPDNVAKFLNINCTNKLFQDKVYVCNGATDLLYFIGFRSNTGNSVLSIAEAELNITVLERVFRDLQSAMGELGVEEDKRPQLTTKRNDSVSGSSSGGAFKAPIVAFDPFKSSIVRTAQQPVRVESETEKQLAALQKRRLEIEGEISDVLRNTEVLFPTTTDPKASQEPSFASEGNDSSNGGVPRSVLSKILAGSGDSEGPPLTTKAVRDLQKAQKERVYSSTLVRVRFPDRVVLQGHFHPRHTVRDVYDWVHSSLSRFGAPADSASSAMTTDVTNDYSLFELCVSPPRTVLSPEFAGPTLTDLKLVPAALILLSWNENHSTVQNMRAAGLISSASTAGQGGVVGRYLVDTLLAGADEKTSSGSSSSSSVTYYPTGASLDTTKPNSNSSNSNSSGEKLSGGSSSSSGGGNKLGGSSKDTGEKKSATGSKPKWFKI